MKMFVLTSMTAAAALATFAWALAPAQGEEDAMAEMVKKAARWTQPGESHKVLERFVGKWNTEMRVMGRAPETGTAEYSWLMPGRWLQHRASGSMMGMPVESYSMMGYDNFKMSFVATGVSSFDTAMNRFEGDLTQDGKTLLMYGTIDEYLTGEHDKMVKYVWRFVSPEKMTFEIHDLPIGETNTKVVEITYTRVE